MSDEGGGVGGRFCKLMYVSFIRRELINYNMLIDGCFICGSVGEYERMMRGCRDVIFLYDLIAEVQKYNQGGLWYGACAW